VGRGSYCNDTVEEMKVPHIREDRGPEKREKRLTKVEEEQFRGVLRAVVPTRNEKVGSYLCRRVRQTPVQRVWFDLCPDCRVCEGRGMRGRRQAKSPGASRTEVETPYVLEALAPVASTDNNHDVLHQIGGVITARGGPLTAHNGDLFPAHPVERRATDVKRPDVVERLQAVPAAEYPDLVLVQHRCMRASRRRNISRREGRPRPSASRDVEDVHAVVVRGALAAADYHDLAPDERRRVSATRRGKVALHLGMGPLHGLCREGEYYKNL
jgi:hypothetical protein